MVDPEAVRRRLRQIDRRVQRAREVAARGRDAFLAAEGLRAQAERHLQVAIQAAIDVAVHVVAEETGATPETYGQAFELLGAAGALDDDLAADLRRAAGLRNVLVHGYLDVDPEQVWDHLARLDVLERFAQAMDRRLAGT